MNPLSLIFQPSQRAAALFLLAAKGGVRGKIARNLLISFHSCDIAPGARFHGRPTLPHPFGIVIGRGAVVGANVRIFQGVTLGSNGRDQYPTVEDGVDLFAHCTVIGPVTVGTGAKVGATALVIKDVVPGGVVKGLAVDGDGSRAAK